MKNFINNNLMNINGTEYTIDKVLFAGNYPILFTCMDNRQELHICVCCQNNGEGKRWLLTKTTPKLVIGMLSDRIAIRDVFLKFPNFRISIFAGENGIEIRENDEKDWNADSVLLPSAGEYMEAEDGEYEEEIAYYSRLNERLYRDCSFKTKTQYKAYADERIEILMDLPGNDEREITGYIFDQTLGTSLELSFNNPSRQSIRYDREQKLIKKMKAELSDLVQKIEVRVEENGKEGVILEAA